MTRRSLFRNVFARPVTRRARKATVRRPPSLETLEYRQVLASYFAASVHDLILSINQSNAAGGTNEITLTQSNHAPYTLTEINNSTHGPTGLPVIAAGNDLTIVGDGDIIQRGATGIIPMRLFDVAAGAKLTLKNLQLQRGWAFGSGDTAQGGAIYSSGTLTLDGVTVHDNLALGKNGTEIITVESLAYDGSSALGGGIYVAGGTATVKNSTLSDNRAVGGRSFLTTSSDGLDYGDGGAAFGGGVYVAAGTVTLTNTTLSGNFAQGGQGANGMDGSPYGQVGDREPADGGGGGEAFGGGVYVAAGTVTLTNDTFSGNFAQGGSGGVGGKANKIRHSGGAGGAGGGAYGGGVFVASSGAATLMNDTFSDNAVRRGLGGTGGPAYSDAEIARDVFVYTTAEFFSDVYTKRRGQDGMDGWDGGVHGGGIDNDGSLTVQYSTIANNGALYGRSQSASTAGGGISSIGGGSLRLIGSIVAGNTSISSNIGLRFSNDFTINGSQIDASYNLIGNGDHTGFINGVNGNLVGTFATPLDPRLGSLQNNGGPTQTMAPRIGSPAINGGSVSLIPTGVATDQRGQPRVNGFSVDMGALETFFNPPTITTYAVQTTSFEGVPVNLSAAATDPEAPETELSYTWVVTQPDSSTVTVTGASATFTPTMAGNYGVTLDVAGPGANASRSSTLTVYSRTAGAKYVQSLFQHELGRTASAAETDIYVSVLGSTDDRAAVVSGIIGSTEANVRVVASWFQSYLGRGPSSSEASIWANQLGGQTQEQVLSGIVGSPEFYNRAQTMGFGGTPDENCVGALYQSLLGRAPSSAELASQVAELQRVGQQSLAMTVLQSIEYRVNVVGSYYTSLLGRAASQAELASHVNSGGDLRAIHVGVASSLEFFVLSANKTPTIATFTVPTTSNEGSPVALSATANNSAGNTYPLSYSWTVTRLDGSTLTTLNGASGTFTPPDDGDYGVLLTVTDADGFSTSRPANLTVANVAPTITSITIPATGAEGNPVTLSATASDPAGAFDLPIFLWTVTRSDGTTLTTLAGDSVKFIPPDNGNYGFSVTVFDADGGVTSLPAPGLVSSWRGEGSANDAMAGNTGALVGGVSYADGKVGPAFNFNGTGRVQVADAANLDLTSAVTLEGWINPSNLAFSGGFGTVIAKSSGAARNYGLFVTSTGALHLSYFTTGGTNVVLETAANLVPVGQFTHVAAVIDPGTGIMEIHVNGKLMASRATAGPLVANSAALTIGATDTGAFGFQGRIDEPTVYSRALSQFEIQSVVNVGSVGKFPSVAVVNLPPTIISVTTALTGVEGSPVTLSAVAYDPAAGDNDPLIYTWTVIRPDGSHLTTMTGASATFIPTDNGNYGYTLTVSDDDGGMASRTIPNTTSIPAGLVSWWRAEGDANDAHDDNHAALVGSGYSAGKVGYAFYFEEVLSQVEVPDSPSLDLTSAVTLEAWINPFNLPSRYPFGAVIAKGNYRQANYGLFVMPDGALELHGTGTQLTSPSGQVVPGEFSHVAAVIDTVSGLMQIYHNGHLVASGATAGPLVANTAPLTIGSANVFFSFDGLIDEPAVYNRALSASEIQSIVNAGSLGKSPAAAVANVAPTPTLSGYNTGMATQVLTYTAAATDPSSIDQAAGFSYSVDWGDGSPLQTINRAADNGSGVSVSHVFTTAGIYTVTLNATDKDGGTTSVTRTVEALAPTSANLQTVISQQGSITTQATTDAQAQSLIAAINGLSAQSNPITVNMDLGTGTYSGSTANPPSGTTLVISGSGGTTTIVGSSPSLHVTGGHVIVQDVSLVNATGAPTLLVSGGNLVLRNVALHESTASNQAALLITGGNVDLGTAGSPGGNTFNVNGPGALIRTSGGGAVSALGNRFQVDGVAQTSPYRIEDFILHALDHGGGGLVSYVADNVFVTPSSGSLQRGIDAVASGGTVNVEAGNYSSYAVGDKLLTVAFENGPVVAQRTDALNPTLRTLDVQGSVGDDKMVFNPGGGVRGAVRVLVNDLPPGTFSPTGRLIANGGAGDDNIQVAAGLTLPAWLYGGDGNDRLKGGNGHSVLVGGAGDDQLIGGGDRSLHIGGLGADTLNGNGGDDLLLAGTTAFDANETALDAILAEWTSPRSYANRVANLRAVGSGPRAHADYFLKVSGPEATVFDDDAVDVLQGAAGSDWFFANLANGVAHDVIRGLAGAEISEELDALQ